MQTHDYSLRQLIEKWLAPTATLTIRRVARIRGARAHCVCVDAIYARGPMSIAFFRQDDGSWNVFPPMSLRPAMATRPAARREASLH